MVSPSAYRARRQDEGDHWPGFVDALATLLLVAIFMLAVFLVAQFVLGRELTGRDEQLAAARAQIDELARQLGLEQDRVAAAQEEARRLQVTLLEVEEEADRLRVGLADAEGRAAALAASLEDEQELSEAARAEAALLAEQIAALNAQLAVLNQALEAAEAADLEQKAQIEALSQRLNAALARKAQELARVRSEFFEKLINALGDRADVRVVGDRFVFETDVVFASAEATITPEGRAQLAQIASVIKDIARDIPDDVDWIIRVDGHTDRRGINTEEFPSNWYLSSARAISVVNFFEEQGVPSRRLVAAGFGQYQPLDPARTSEAYTRNRRIELKLDSR